MLNPVWGSSWASYGRKEPVLLGPCQEPPPGAWGWPSVQVGTGGHQRTREAENQAGRGRAQSSEQSWQARSSRRVEPSKAGITRPILKKRSPARPEATVALRFEAFPSKPSRSGFLQAQPAPPGPAPPSLGPFLLTAVGAQLVPLSADLLFPGHRGALDITDSARCCLPPRQQRLGEKPSRTAPGEPGPRSQNVGDMRDPPPLPAMPQRGGSHAGSSPVAGSPTLGEGASAP